MPYPAVHGKNSFERASKIAHSEILNDPRVREFVRECVLPGVPAGEEVEPLLVDVPLATTALTAVIAVDGGLSTAPVRKEFPSAEIAFFQLGPVFFHLDQLESLEKEPFLAPEDMATLKNVDRYSLVLPTKTVRAPGAATFVEGVRRTVQGFLSQGKGRLLQTLRWLLFHGWSKTPATKSVHCVDADCAGIVTFGSSTPDEIACGSCGTPILLSDTLRLHERIDEDGGAGAIVAYLLNALEQIVLVDAIRGVMETDVQLLRDVLIVRDGPLAFFGTTAPLHKPMRALVAFLERTPGGNPLHLVGLEKTGTFVEHAQTIRSRMKPWQALIPTNEYIRRHVKPGDADAEVFGLKSDYGAKVIFRDDTDRAYVCTVPKLKWDPKNYDPTLNDLVNAVPTLRTLARLRCSLHENSLIPIVLANRLVSLAEVPSGDILAKFVKRSIRKETGAS